MKIFLPFCAALVLAHATELPEPKHLGVKATDIASEETLEKLLEALKQFAEDGDTSGIFNLEMNPMIDELLEDLKSMIILEVYLELLGIVGSIHLTNGWLQDMATVFRYDDIVASYKSADKVITFTVPLSFKDLLFTYKYVTRVLLLTIDGDVQGKIEDVRMDLLLTYDATNGFVLTDLDMQDSGKVTIKFTGNDLVDWITNAMTTVITTVLKPLIIAILQNNVKSVGNEVVAAVNEYLNNSTLIA